QSLDEGLLPLMSEEDVIRVLEYVPRFREVEVYIEIGISLVEKHLMERMTNADSGNGDFFDLLKLGSPLDTVVEGLMSNVQNEGSIYICSYHNVDEPEEISDMFVDLDQALDELDQVIEAQDVLDLFAVYDHTQLMTKEEDQVGDVIPVEVVAEDKVAEETIIDGNVVNPTEVYDAMVALVTLKDQTRAIKRRRVMDDKEDSRMNAFMFTSKTTYTFAMVM
ncbi:hypothetical protein Tco_1019031, partial [Tanacetum coccineum]